MSDTVYQDDGAWHLVQTKPKQEFRALENLENQGFRCLLPTLDVERIVSGRRRIATEPLFSRYLFVYLMPDKGGWTPIRSTRGVSSIVSFGGRFATLPDACVAALAATPRLPAEPMFRPGERVSIASGPFAGMEGIYEVPDGDIRALVLIDLMNQPQKLNLAVETLRKVA
ncbi:transcription/translation regulatory transformer protein RfaH [Noviherbaspirillum sp. ST9]|uniref:transcription/translation regulatory transformer protein RfaH n=1 Tax=Noviherbaspirillum sp. ST9 TaxID=3401606 RepID=UPI003B586C7F